MRKRSGFTIVELLVVVGIIAVLLSLLMPTLTRAREQAKLFHCLNNLRQLGLAMTEYLADNDGNFPRPAAGVQYEDWNYYDGGRDMNQSRIAPYLRSPDEPLDLSLLRCPSDNLDRHPWYPYSYTANEYLFRTQVLGNKTTLRMVRIAHPANTIMFIDESAETIDDGCWAPQNYFHDLHNLLSNRHDWDQEDYTDPNAGRGTVAFADGHAAFIPRIDSTEDKFYRGYPGELDYNAN